MASAQLETGSRQRLNSKEVILYSRQVVCECCGKAKKKVKGYCPVCNLNLCKSCMKKHKRQKRTKKLQLHDVFTLQNVRQMNENRDEFSEKCKQHPSRYLKYFCSVCKTTCCHLCNIESHRGCRKVDYIPDIVDSFEESKEFKDHNQKINHLLFLLEKNNDKIDENRRVICNSSDDALQAIKKQRREINKYFDKLENMVCTENFKKKDEGIRILQQLAGQNNNHSSTLTEMKYDLNEKVRDGYICQVFVAVKNSHEALAEIEADTDRLLRENKVSRCVYVPNTEIVRSLDTMQHFGYITETKEAKVLYPYCTTTREGEIYMRTGDVVNVIEAVDKEWWKGELNGQILEFPENYVEIAKEYEKKKARVLYQYDAKPGNDELDLLGEIIRVIEEGQGEWWKGEKNGQVGLFPGSYVELLTDNDDTTRGEDTSDSSFED